MFHDVDPDDPAEREKKMKEAKWKWQKQGLDVSDIPDNQVMAQANQEFKSSIVQLISSDKGRILIKK